MGTKQRRERERQEVRQGILSSAREIALQEGWQAVTMRKVAERIEYSPPTIYEYFASKEAILTELLHEGFRKLLAALQSATAGSADPETQILLMVDGYWHFAMQYPELYRAMHGLDGITFDCLDFPPEAEQTFMLARATLEAWTRISGAHIADLNDAVDMLWGVLHGLVSLHMNGRMDEGQQHTRLLMEQTVHLLLHAWRTQT
jgi:AcrR family transcriptional regulator